QEGGFALQGIGHGSPHQEGEVLFFPLGGQRAAGEPYPAAQRFRSMRRETVGSRVSSLLPQPSGRQRFQLRPGMRPDPRRAAEREPLATRVLAKASNSKSAFRGRGTPRPF